MLLGFVLCLGLCGGAVAESESKITEAYLSEQAHKPPPPERKGSKITEAYIAAGGKLNEDADRDEKKDPLVEAMRVVMRMRRFVRDTGVISEADKDVLYDYMGEIERYLDEALEDIW